MSSNLPPLRALSLDFAGTLAIERHSRAAIYALAAHNAGMDVEEDIMVEAMGRAWLSLPLEIQGAFRATDSWFRHFIRQVFVDDLGMDPARLGAVQEELFAAFSDATNFQVFPGAKKLLDVAANSGLRVVIVSNWTPRLPDLMRKLDLIQGVDAIVTSSSEQVEKPNPELFRRAMSRVGVGPAATLHVGDHLTNDVTGAQAAGIEAIWIDREGTLTPPADVFRLTSLEDVVAVVRNLCL